MNSPIVPIGLFAALVLSAVSGVVIGGPVVAVLAIAGFAGSLAALGWVVVRADQAADPRPAMLTVPDRFDERWAMFEHDFWAHVAARRTGAQ